MVFISLKTYILNVLDINTFKESLKYNKQIVDEHMRINAEKYALFFIILLLNKEIIISNKKTILLGSTLLLIEIVSYYYQIMIPFHLVIGTYLWMKAIFYVYGITKRIETLKQQQPIKFKISNIIRIITRNIKIRYKIIKEIYENMQKGKISKIDIGIMLIIIIISIIIIRKIRIESIGEILSVITTIPIIEMLIYGMKRATEITLKGLKLAGNMIKKEIKNIEFKYNPPTGNYQLKEPSIEDKYSKIGSKKPIKNVDMHKILVTPEGPEREPIKTYGPEYAGWIKIFNESNSLIERILLDFFNHNELHKDYRALHYKIGKKEISEAEILQAKIEIKNFEKNWMQASKHPIYKQFLKNDYENHEFQHIFHEAFLAGLVKGIDINQEIEILKTEKQFEEFDAKYQGKNVQMKDTNNFEAFKKIIERFVNQKDYKNTACLLINSDFGLFFIEKEEEEGKILIKYLPKSEKFKASSFINNIKKVGYLNEEEKKIIEPFIKEVENLLKEYKYIDAKWEITQEINCFVELKKSAEVGASESSEVIAERRSEEETTIKPSEIRKRNPQKVTENQVDTNPYGHLEEREKKRMQEEGKQYIEDQAQKKLKNPEEEEKDNTNGVD